MWPFKCQDPHKYLTVIKPETKVFDKHPEDPATITTYHLCCAACGEDLRLKYAEFDSPFIATSARGKVS